MSAKQQTGRPERPLTGDSGRQLDVRVALLLELEGYTAALAGFAPDNNPYAPSAQRGLAWLSGWFDGSARLS